MASLRLPKALLHLILLTTLASCSPHAVITPYAALPAVFARQDEDLEVTCGYIDAGIRNTPSPLTKTQDLC